MKKLSMIFIFIILIGSIAFANNISILGNLEFFGDYSKESKSKLQITPSKRIGLGVIAEGTIPTWAWGISSYSNDDQLGILLSMGAGGGLLKHNGFKKETLNEGKLTAPSFTSIPIYLFLKLNFVTLKNPMFSPYIKFNYGYAFNFVNNVRNDEYAYKSSNKSYNSFGIGLETERFIIELARRNFGISIKNGFNEYSPKYLNESYNHNSFSLMLGYKFNEFY